MAPGLRKGAARSVISARRRLRICHLAYTFYENDNRVRRYVESLAAQGHDVEVLALRRAGQAKTGSADGVRIFRIQRRAVTEKRPAAYLLKILAFFVRAMVLLSIRHLRRPYDVVHVHNVPDFLVFTALIPKLTGARVILDIHDIVPEFYAGKFSAEPHSIVFRALLIMEKVSCRFANHVVVSNDLWQKKLIGRAVEAAKCTTMLNYPDLRMFKPLPADQRRRDGRFVMLYPGTLNHHQGLDIAIRAFAQVKDRMPDAELHIYGEGPARPQLVELANDCRMADRIRIMDLLSLEQIAQVIASADVGVVPKRADGFGNEAFSTKTLEFIACCVPVLVSRTKIDDHYFDETLVHFFAPGSDADLARAMLDLYQTRLENADWMKAARRFALRNSWQERVHEYLSLVDTLVETPLARPAVAR
jgi:glycosyltransferase involved in cell wall biosynthesis